MGSIEGVISLGPWGGQNGGDRWTFRGIREITEIIIRHDGMSIVSISFRDASGHTSGTFGGNNASSSNSSSEERKIEIRSPSEYLKTISGTYGGDSSNSVTVIKTLSFITNLTTHGPFGSLDGTGELFSIPIVDSVVVGFFGRADSHLNAIGIFVQPAPTKGSISLGPWGGSAGNAFNFRVGSWITQITVRDDNNNIKSISFKDSNGHQYGVFGGNRPSDIGTERTVNLNGHSEYVKSITGTTGIFEGITGVTSLSFVTNLSTYGPFGRTSGGGNGTTSFTLPNMEGAVVTGFHGRAGWYLDAIGIHCQVATPVGHGTILMGPWGGPGGNPWTYTSTHGINEIIIHSDINVKSISFRDTSGLASPTFGGNNPNDPGTRQIVHISWPAEHFISISGTYSNFNIFGVLTITSLSFITNLTEYGPFGTPHGFSFSMPMINSRIVGFHGRAGDFLDAIGIHVKSET